MDYEITLRPTLSNKICQNGQGQDVCPDKEKYLAVKNTLSGPQ
jgi:hypothetical protein